MLFLFGGSDKKGKPEPKRPENHERARDLFLQGRFPVMTTDLMEGKNISKVLGLVCCRGYDSEEAFFGMAAMAINKGAHAIVGYCENVAFHPDGSKYFSCFGTAVMFAWEQDEKFGAAALREAPLQMTPRSSESHTDRLPHAQHSGSSVSEERPLAAARAMESSARVEDFERRPHAGHTGRMPRHDNSSAGATVTSGVERPGRLSARVDDDLDLPPLRPVAGPSW